MRARGRIAIAGAAVAAGVIGWRALESTPKPMVALIRRIFDHGAAVTIAAMRAAATGASTATTLRLGPVDATLHRPADAGDAALPVIVWLHGGAWVSGSRGDVDPYGALLAERGFAVVTLDYPVGPEAAYPASVQALNDAVGALVERADDLALDAGRIVLAGDSAGAQLASQLAVLATDADLARLAGIRSSLADVRLAGLVLHCGVYDLRRMGALSGIIARAYRTALWAYTGRRDWATGPAAATMSTIDWVSDRLPPVFISGGNGDGLTWMQSLPMAAALRAAGVEVTELFWPAAHEPALPHEYQFHLDTAEAQEALTATVAWLERVTAR